MPSLRELIADAHYYLHRATLAMEQLCARTQQIEEIKPGSPDDRDRYLGHSPDHA